VAFDATGAHMTPPAVVARWALLAVLPLWSVYLAHVVTGPNMPTGFIMAEMPYYCADGREIFERGNGFMYCNPYDPDPAAPVIYFHWLLWLLGFMMMKLHISPGMATVTTGAVAGVVCAWLTFRLVEAILPSRRWLGLCYLAVMWGGGLLVAAAGVANLCTRQQLVVNLLRFDPFEGWWFLNWGRNLVLPNETVYHALVAGSWLAVVRGRPWAAVAAVTALAATHPFSGIQHLLVLGAWLVFQRPRSLVSAAPLVALAAVTAVFTAYYFVYLPAFPQHRALEKNWSLAWIMPLMSLVAAGAPVACLAAARCWRDRGVWRPEMSFFLIAAFVSLLLVKHELFISPRQPLHFSRGYTWTPLALLGLPLVQSFLEHNLVHPLRLGRVVVFAVAAGLAVLDNATFIAYQWNQPWAYHQDVRVSPSMRAAFGVLERTGLRGTAVVVKPAGDEWEDYNYLLATYTGMTPLLGHPHISPIVREATVEVQAWQETGAVSPRLATVEAMIVPIDFPQARLPGGAAGWQTLARCGTVRVVASRKANPPRVGE